MYIYYIQAKDNIVYKETYNVKTNDSLAYIGCKKTPGEMNKERNDSPKNTFDKPIISDEHAKRRKLRAQMTKDQNEILMQKYYNCIMCAVKNNDFPLAKKKAEILTSFLTRIRYKDSVGILDKIYNIFGIYQLITFQDVKQWDVKKNTNRILLLLGCSDLENEICKSMYGPNIVNLK